MNFLFVFRSEKSNRNEPKSFVANNNNNNNNTFIDKENQYDTNVSVIKIKSSLWYQIIFIIKNA